MSSMKLTFTAIFAISDGITSHSAAKFSLTVHIQTQRRSCASEHLHQPNTSEQIEQVELFYRGHGTTKATNWAIKQNFN